MPKRKIIRIDEDKCNGCGECIVDCPEGALAIVDGKARLVNESFCDGLGACIGKCPVGALTIEEREADEFDEEAANANMARAAAGASVGACPATAARAPVSPPAGGCPGSVARRLAPRDDSALDAGEQPSRLGHWPVQLALVMPGASFLRDADVLLVADCVPFAYASFHARFLAGARPVLVACTKLDDAGAHARKLAAVLKQSGLKSLTVVRMEVPCCSGLTRIAEQAREQAGSAVPLTEVVISIDGRVK